MTPSSVWEFLRELDELASILARQIRHRADTTLAPEDVVRKLRDIAHVDAATDDDATLDDVAKRFGDQRADGCQHDGGVEFLGRALLAAACPSGTEISREILRIASPGRVNAKISRPSKRASCAMMWAAAPKP